MLHIFDFLWIELLWISLSGETSTRCRSTEYGRNTGIDRDVAHDRENVQESTEQEGHAPGTDVVTCLLQIWSLLVVYLYIGVSN